MKQIINSTSVPTIDGSISALDSIKVIADNNVTNTLQENPVVMNAVAERSKATKSFPGMGSAPNPLHNNSMMSSALGEAAMRVTIPNYQVEIPALRAYEEWNRVISTNLAAGLTALMTNPIVQDIQSILSNVGRWLQTIDFTPLTKLLENLQNIGFKYDYKEVNGIFLKAMFDARWFPYAGWITKYKFTDKMLQIINTSRASKNRIKRIDKLIFSYYDKEEINNLKRGWRCMKFPSYMTRILVQSVQAYHRREYALTVIALSTLWEGIIQEKVNDDSFRISRKTRENLRKLVEENEFDKIISSFSEEFIFYKCNGIDEVKPDVPGRHGIAHCWYNTYPNRKMALNAILFTDFLLRLKPIENTEDSSNGQVENVHGE